MAGLEDVLPAVVAFVLIALVASVGALILSGFQNSASVLKLTNAGTNSLNANTITAANTLNLALSGSYSWISASNPLTVAVTGNSVSSYSNGVGVNTATAGTVTTETFTVTSPAASQSLGTATSGNFFNITAVKLTGVDSAAAPSITATVTEYVATNGLSFGPTSISAHNTSTVVATAAYNATHNGLKGVNTFASYLPLIALVIVASILIGIVLVAFAFGGRREERY